MKNLFFSLTIIFLFSMANMGLGQNGIPNCLAKNTQTFNECAAIFLNDKMLVNEYTPNGKCKVTENASGILYVSTTELNVFSLLPYQSVGFKVAIRNNKTNTLWLYSEETFMSIDLKKIIEKCEAGDEIIILTVDKSFSLPHNTLEIEWGC